MKTHVILKEKTALNLADEVATFGVRLGAVACLLFGILGVACLVSALFSAGPVAVIQGYIAAVATM